MYLIPLILFIASAIVLADNSSAPGNISIASPPSGTISSSMGPSETPFVITQVANCINKTYIYCSHHELTGNYNYDLLKAAEGLDYFCPHHEIDPYRYYRTMWGRTQIYVCNYGDSLLPCQSTEFWAANYLLDDKCGHGMGGWMYRETEDHTWAVGRDPNRNEHEFAPECGMWS